MLPKSHVACGSLFIRRMANPNNTTDGGLQKDPSDWNREVSGAQDS
jgi:hypothetical protein